MSLSAKTLAKTHQKARRFLSLGKESKSICLTAENFLTPLKRPKFPTNFFCLGTFYTRHRQVLELLHWFILPWNVEDIFRLIIIHCPEKLIVSAQQIKGLTLTCFLYFWCWINIVLMLLIWSLVILYDQLPEAVVMMKW